MEREISSGAMLGIVLLALAAVIGLGFGVFAITKGVANEGTVNMQDSLATVSDQAFLDYDQKVVTGTQATAALKTFEGKPYAILFATRALQDVKFTSGALATGEDKKFIPDHKTIQFLTIDGKTYINYNALVDPAGVAGKVGTEDAAIIKANGAFTLDKLQSENGNIKFDNVTAGIFKAGNAEYVSSSSKFQANVIKDPSGNYVGLVFEELK